MSKLKRLVLDVLKPHQPSIVELSRDLAEVEGVEGVNSSLIEVDEEVKNVKITMEGSFSEKPVREVIDRQGASIHSIDEAAVGERLVDKVETPQD